MDEGDGLAEPRWKGKQRAASWDARWLRMAALTVLTLTASSSMITIAAAAPAVTAAEMHAGMMLTQDTWTDNVGKGIWLVEHYSPYCHHCRQFAPTWIELAAARKYQENTIDFHMGQVDCSISGDLCDANNVKGYPSLFLYENGEFVTQFKKDRTMEKLNKWLETVLPADTLTDHEDIAGSRSADAARVIEADAPTAAQVIEVTSQSMQGYGVNPSSQLVPDNAQETAKLLQVQDPRDMAKRSLPNPQGQVISAVAAQIDDIVMPDSGGSPAFVKYFAPWCSHCKRLKPVWAKLASALQNKVNIVEVDCDNSANKARCRSAGIKGYPTLIFYNHGEIAEYPGARSFEAMEAFALKLATSGSPLQSIDQSGLAAISAEQDVFFIYLHPSAAAKAEGEAVREASRVLLGTAPIFSSSDSAVFEKYNVPPTTSHLLVFKQRDDTPAALLQLNLKATSTELHAKQEHDVLVRQLVSWLHANRYSMFAELTSANYKDYTEDGQHKHQSYIVLAALSEQLLGTQAVAQHKAELAKIAQVWQQGLHATPRSKPAHFVWINGDNWAKWLKQNYGLTLSAKQPTVAILDPKNERYFPIDAQKSKLSVDGVQLTAALDNMYAGKLMAYNSVGLLERFGRWLLSYLERPFMWIGNHPILATVIFVLLLVVTVSVLVVLIEPEEAPVRVFSTSPAHQPKYPPPAHSALYAPAPSIGVKKD